MSLVTTFINGQEYRVPFSCQGKWILEFVGGDKRVYLETPTGPIAIERDEYYDLQAMSLYTATQCDLCGEEIKENQSKAEMYTTRTPAGAELDEPIWLIVHGEECAQELRAKGWEIT